VQIYKEAKEKKYINSAKTKQKNITLLQKNKNY